MDVTIRHTSGFYDGREVSYIELEVSGDRHTLSIRKYPKNISLQMWKNSDKRGTRISMKMPHESFSFSVQVTKMIENFKTDLDYDTLEVLVERWNSANRTNNF